MSAHLPPSLSRLASVNPVLVDDDLGRAAEAQAELARILASDPELAPRRARRWAPRRLLLIAMPAMVLASGGAVAATDPFGWWQSRNLNTAQYRIDTTKVVRTPTIAQIRCARALDGFRCGAHLHGRPYMLIDRISAPPSGTFNRAALRRDVARALATGQISRKYGQRVLADLAAVPDRFLNQLNQAQVYSSIGGGTIGANGVELAPPPGVPAFLACQPNRALLTCQNLNGDTGVPIGSGVYSALQTGDWRPAPPRRPDPQLNFVQHMTPAEIRLMLDIMRRSHATTTSTSSSSQTTGPPNAGSSPSQP
jgi:hypothetical protein